MSHTRSARKSDGSHDVEIRDYAGAVVHTGNYPDMRSADAACAHWERLVTIGLVDGTPAPTLDEILSDDDLLRELGIDG